MEISYIKFHNAIPFISGGATYEMHVGHNGVDKIQFLSGAFHIDLDNGDYLIIPQSSVSYGRGKRVNKETSSNKRAAKKSKT